MDNRVVVMPACHRPEFAALALECLGAAKNCPDVFVYVDDQASDSRWEQFKYVVERHAPARTYLTRRDPHVLVSSGCWNILNSIKNGRETGAEYVWLVEEDVLVCPDIFVEHPKYLASGNYAAACGRKCRRFYILSPDIYTNPGSCLTAKLVDAVIPHINETFYANTGGYMEEVLGHVEGIHGLDDGLIRRVLWKNDWHVTYPEPFLCSHVGFQAYENKYDFCHVDYDKTIADQIENLRGLFLTLERGKEPHGRYLGDLDPISPSVKTNLATA